MKNIWLLQMDTSTIVELDLIFIKTGAMPRDFNPPADRKGNEVKPGDLLVLWKMKGKDKNSGAVALGVADELPEIYHELNYHDADDERAGMRSSVQFRFTHWFPDAIVDKQELVDDSRFENFTIFKRGRAIGPNPWPVTSDQWDAILERVPAWADLGLPLNQYEISVEALFRADRNTEPIEQMRALVKKRDYDRIGGEVRSAGTFSDTVVEARMEPLKLPASIDARLVIWDTKVVARDYEQAWSIGVYLLKKAVDGLSSEDIRVVEFGQPVVKATGTS